MWSTKCVYNSHTHTHTHTHTYIYIYKDDLALSNLQWFICHKIKPTLTKSNVGMGAKGFKYFVYIGRGALQRILNSYLRWRSLPVMSQPVTQGNSRNCRNSYEDQVPSAEQTIRFGQTQRKALKNTKKWNMIQFFRNLMMLFFLSLVQYLIIESTVNNCFIIIF